MAFARTVIQVSDGGLLQVRKPLRGQPLPRGRHTRFSESGGATDSPSAERVLLRGVPAPSGAHLRFGATPEK